MTNNTANAAYAQIFIDRLLKGWSAYLLSFMFHQLPGTTASVQRHQLRLIEEAYRRALTRSVREPTALSQDGRLPVWLCCPDFPVHKHEKNTSAAALPSDGQHAHEVAALPPWSRHVFNMADHFEQNQQLYVRRDGLSHVHATAITHDVDKVCDYATKMMARGRVEPDALLILPRSLSEVRGEARVGRNSSNFG